MQNISATYKGLIIAALMIVAELISFYVLKNEVQSKFKYITYSIYTVGIIWSLFSLKQRSDGNLVFKDFFTEGFKTFVVVVFLMVVYTFIFVKTNPHILDKFIDENNKLILAEGNRTPAEVLTNAEKIKSAFLLTMAMGATIIYLIIGALISAVGAGFLSQQKAND
jgi:hypothetical protein